LSVVSVGLRVLVPTAGGQLSSSTIIFVVLVVLALISQVLVIVLKKEVFTVCLADLL
jgi:hypothetical protein